MSTALILALAIGVPVARAQQSSGEIVGTVTDPSGATVRGATVTIKDVDRGTSLTVHTNEFGAYDFPTVSVGTYVVTVSQTGFQTVNHEKFTLILNQTARLDFQLKVGQTTEVVEVAGLTPIMQTDTSSSSSLIDAKTAAEMPLATHNTNELTLISSPGVITPNPLGFEANQNTFGTGRPYINGAREQENNFILDGMDNNQPDNNDVAYVPAPDALQEFNLITGNAPADFGSYLGGVVNETIKSGTNDFHGDLYGYLRNSGLSANSWSNNLNGLPRQSFRYDDFGGTLGGPVLKDKLFFFVDYAESLFNQSIPTQLSIIPSAERQGNFAGICPTGFTNGLCNTPQDQLFNPFSSANPATRTPFLNNQIPVGMFNSASNAIINSPLYNFGGGLTTTNTGVNNDRSYQGDIKLDYIPSERDHAVARWSEQYVGDPTTNSVQLLGNANKYFPLKNVVLDETHSFSSHLINDARFGFQYFPVTEGFTNPTGQNLGATFGIPGEPTSFLPLLTFAGTVSPIGNANLVESFHDTTFQFSDTVLWTHGKHEMHFGFQALHYIMNDIYPGNAGLAGEFDFNGQYTGNSPGPTGNSVADFLLGLPATVELGSANAHNEYLRNSLFGIFGQDNWRIRDNLTLNLGLRYELTTARQTDNGQDVNFNLVSGVPQIGTGYNTYTGIDNFQPRLGFAYQPKWNWARNTVVRGAYGISSFVEANGINNLPYQNPPFVEAHTANFLGQAQPNFTLSQGFSTFPATGCTVAELQADQLACLADNTLHLTNPNLQPAVDQQWNLTIERQLNKNMVVKLGYVGNKIDHMSDIFIYNQSLLNANGAVSPGPFAQSLINCCGAGNAPTIRFNDSSGIQRYNAMQVTVEQRTWHGLQYRANYTWSKCLSNGLGYFGQFGDEEAPAGSVSQTNSSFFFQNAYDPLADYGRCIADAAGLFNGYLSYDLPFGKGKMFGGSAEGFLNSVIGGWSLGSDFILHSGFAINPSGPDQSGTNSDGATRPNCVAGVSQSGSGQIVNIGGVLGEEFLNPAAVSLPAKGTFGNCGEGSFRGPGAATANMSVNKRFAISERTGLLVSAQFINLTNTPILGAPNGSCSPACNGIITTGAAGGTGAGSFGLITSANPGRVIQFGMKLLF